MGLLEWSPRDADDSMDGAWGLMQAGKANLSFPSPSMRAGNDYFAKRAGPYLQGAQTLPDFVAGMKKEGYNSQNPKYYEDLASVINNIGKWRAACGIQ